MDQSTLVIDEINAGNRFLQEFEKSTPVFAAFWLKAGEDEAWNLFVASNRFNHGKLGMAYQEVLLIMGNLKEYRLEPFRIKFVGLTDPLVKAVTEFYRTHNPKIPMHLRDSTFGDAVVEEIYLIQGPTGEYTMPSGREVLDRIIDQEATFFQQNEKQPRKMKLPVLMAYDLAKCGRDQLGDLSGKVFKEGITAFEKEGFHGMSVEIIRDRNAVLQLE